MKVSTLANKKEPLQSSAVVRVIGDRGSGKTAYMASLARWPNADPNGAVKTVIPVGDAAKYLVEQAQNILEQGLQLPQTGLNANPDEVKDYTLQITITRQFSWKNLINSLTSPLLNLNVSCKDYGGEFFIDLLQQAGKKILQDYMEDCSQSTGIMLLIDGTSRRKDQEYAVALDRFFAALDRTDVNVGKRRIALVLTKCEQSDLWVNRHKPDFIAPAAFPQVCKKLSTWQQMGGGDVNYFTASAFGMLGTKYPEPNITLLTRGRDGVTAVIKNPKSWRPFGLVAPIYWLCTGDRHKLLENG
ncbi:hypothetical protein H6F32_11420 [Anabaena sp. FACHB-1237]|uniref:hypothetical protein n=1 Tax=Anabaena sp. FACHB-1237 TaxID=2692769 RepID=UPI0016813736|nr:hypothetical protein [Anabaena sp. FACHB-1237]MBD2138184.1 hypothetical protein [Anabaena sp. FACHB-1237]